MNSIWTLSDKVAETRHKLTVDDVYAMVEAGILGANDRIELIDGELIKLSPKNIRHETFKNKIAAYLTRQLPQQINCWVETTVRLSDTSYVEPDVTVFEDDPSREAIYGHETLLVIEVSDTSLAYDRDVKADLYAAHGIQEYWLIDVNAEQVTVHRAPENGTYSQIATRADTAPLSPLALPDISVRLKDLLS